MEDSGVSEETKPGRLAQIRQKLTDGIITPDTEAGSDLVYLLERMEVAEEALDFYGMMAGETGQTARDALDATETRPKSS